MSEGWSTHADIALPSGEQRGHSLRAGCHGPNAAQDGASLERAAEVQEALQQFAEDAGNVLQRMALGAVQGLGSGARTGGSIGGPTGAAVGALTGALVGGIQGAVQSPQAPPASNRPSPARALPPARRRAAGQPTGPQLASAQQAAAHCLGLFGLPQMQHALQLLATGREEPIRVGRHDIPPAAFANLLAQLATQAATRPVQTAAAELVPSYLLNASGEFDVDPAVPAERASALMRVLGEHLRAVDERSPESEYGELESEDEEEELDDDGPYDDDDDEALYDDAVDDDDDGDEVYDSESWLAEDDETDWSAWS